MKRTAMISMLALAACSKSSEMAPAAQMMPKEEGNMGGAGAPADDEAPGAAPMRERRMLPKPAAPALKKMALGALRGGGGAGMDGIAGIMAAEANAPAPEPEKSSGGEGEAGAEPAPTRAWFPETFLFEPRVVTSAEGDAIVPVKVPDRLTTWRVLGLAHARNGSQAGSVTSFLGTLPVYVDPVVPAFLTAADEIVLPIQVVNTTGDALTRTLGLAAEGAKLDGAATRAVKIAPYGSAVEKITLRAPRAGSATLKASLGSSDAIERVIPIFPSGRPVEVQRGGTLAAPRKLDIEGPPKLDPDSARVRLMVFPGALSVLRSEIAFAPSRGDVAGDGYTLLLSGKAPELLRALGDEPDAESLRKMSLIAGQRALRHSRSPDLATSVLLAEAALAHGQNPVLSRLGERLLATIAASQRPDGTFGGGQGWTLQRVLVTTADAVRAAKASDAGPKAKQRATSISLRASGAFERNLGRVEDAYTAAAILASGAVSGSLADQLRERVRKAVAEGSDGARYLPVDRGVVRADGAAPSVAEATALAVLALEGDKDAAAWRPDLGATLLGGYSPSWGWGDGVTNLACLRAVLALFKEPIPEKVRIVLELDGKQVAEGALDRSRVKEVMTLEAPAGGAGGVHTWSVRAEPPVPGLGFSLALRAFVPWEKEPAQGLELEVTRPDEMTAAKPAEISLVASAPANMPLVIKHALPAGVQADRPSLDVLVGAGTITRFETPDGAVILHAPARQPGQTFSARYKVIPTLAGTLHASASSIAAEGRADLTFWVPPVPWKVK